MEKSDIRSQVEEFMVAAKQEIKTSPGAPSDDVIRLRAKLIVEEVFELLEALFDPDNKSDLGVAHAAALKLIESPIKVDMVEVADACGDIDYVTEGLRLAFGINGKPIADEVQRTNMEKFGEGSWVRESDGKQMKPPGWKAPDILKFLKEQGYED